MLFTRRVNLFSSGMGGEAVIESGVDSVAWFLKETIILVRNAGLQIKNY